MPSPVLAELSVTIQGKPAGTVRQHENGTLTFAYLPAYQGAPLSLSMPCLLYTSIEDGIVTFDMNHELAGKDLNFDIELVEVED